MYATASPDLNNKEHILKPPLKWAGGKRWLVPHLEPIWERLQHRRLVEPFCGGLAVALGLMPEQALLNDINPHAINFYAWISRGLRIDIDMQNDSDFYYGYRSKFNHLVTSGQELSKQSAQLFYYLNRTGYNGLCRFNSKGEFNVPFGRYKRINYVRDFFAYKPVLSRWNFLSQDFADIPLSPDDFIYADPPYDVEFRQYSKGGFDWNDQVRLAKWLASHPGPVIASNQATERILDLYSSLGFILIELDAPRMISCTGDRTRVKEMLALRGVRDCDT
jgi:DNA adenine methylase